MPPQVIQGMWQAYGQMFASRTQSLGQIKAARTRGWFGIAATGVIGIGLFGYRVALSDQRKKVKAKQSELLREREQFEVLMSEKENAITNREDNLAMLECKYNSAIDEHRKLIIAYTLLSKREKIAEDYVSLLCGNNKSCLAEYGKLKDATQPTGIKDDPTQINIRS